MGKKKKRNKRWGLNLKRCDLCGWNISTRNFQRHLNESCPARPPEKQIAVGTKAATKTCEFCGYVVLAKRYDHHLKALCTIKCECGEVVKGRALKEHRKATRHQEIMTAKKEAEMKETFSTLLKAGRIKPIKLSWKLLPLGEHPFADIVRHYKWLQERNTNVEYQMARLDKVYNLGPSSIYIGIDEFEGYIIFHFEKNQIAVLECPVVGNAIYVFKDDWKMLSRLSKAELLNNHRGKVVRIIHTGEWFYKLKALFHAT